MAATLGKWWRIEAPHFTAGVRVDDTAHAADVIFYTAPILAWTRGKTLAWLLDYCHKKGWKAEELP